MDATADAWWFYPRGLEGEAGIQLTNEIDRYITVVESLAAELVDAVANKEPCDVRAVVVRALQEDGIDVDNTLPTDVAVRFPALGASETTAHDDSDAGAGNDESFVDDAFTGSRRGYMFTMGPRGLGYYKPNYAGTYCGVGYSFVLYQLDEWEDWTSSNSDPQFVAWQQALPVVKALRSAAQAAELFAAANPRIPAQPTRDTLATVLHTAAPIGKALLRGTVFSPYNAWDVSASTRSARDAAVTTSYALAHFLHDIGAHFDTGVEHYQGAETYRGLTAVACLAAANEYHKLMWIANQYDVSGQTVQAEEWSAGDHNGWTPLHHAIKRRFVKTAQVLLDNGADTACRTAATGSTALHMAASIGDAACAKLLVAASADVKALDDAGRTPSRVAAIRGFRSLSWILELEEELPRSRLACLMVFAAAPARCHLPVANSMATVARVGSDLAVPGGPYPGLECTYATHVDGENNDNRTRYAVGEMTLPEPCADPHGGDGDDDSADGRPYKADTIAIRRHRRRMAMGVRCNCSICQRPRRARSCTCARALRAHFRLMAPAYKVGPSEPEYDPHAAGAHYCAPRSAPRAHAAWDGGAAVAAPAGAAHVSAGGAAAAAAPDSKAVDTTTSSAGTAAAASAVDTPAKITERAKAAAAEAAATAAAAASGAPANAVGSDGGPALEADTSSGGSSPASPAVAGGNTSADGGSDTSSTDGDAAPVAPSDDVTASAPAAPASPRTQDASAAVIRELAQHHTSAASPEGALARFVVQSLPRALCAEVMRMIQ